METPDFSAHYDEVTDVLYLTSTPHEATRSEMLSDWLIVTYGEKTEQILGLQVLDVKYMAPSPEQFEELMKTAIQLMREFADSKSREEINRRLISIQIETSTERQLVYG